MTGYEFAEIVLAAIVALVIATFSCVLMIRDYALKYTLAMERGKNISNETAARQRVPIVGSHVKFQDEHGVEHDAVVIAIHNPQMLTLAVTGNVDPDMKQYFSDIEKGAFIAHTNIQPLHGFDYGYTEEELRSLGFAEEYNDLYHYSRVN